MQAHFNHAIAGGSDAEMQCLSTSIKGGLSKIIVEWRLPSVVLPAIGLANRTAATLAATTVARAVLEFLHGYQPT